MPAALSRSPELMNADDTTLLLIDLQERLVPLVRGGQRIVWNAERLLEGAAALGVSVAATEQYPEKLGPTLPSLAGHIDGAASKLMFSGRQCAEMIDGWLAAGRTRVLIAGIETHVCVQQTALDLLSAGLRVYVAVDAVGARSTVDHEVALGRMTASGVTLTTAESALFEWCVEAGTLRFKTISALAKRTPPPG